MSTTGEQQTLHAAATAYRLLSACYYQPEEAFVEEDLFGQLSEALAVAFPQAVPVAERLSSSFRVLGVDHLLLDYTRLFLGPFGILAKPYGSIYLDGERQVMGESTMRTLELYRQVGFDVDDDFREAPDHVAVELEFLYLLTQLTAMKMAEGDTVEVERLSALKRQFLDEHLGRWLGIFTDKVRTGTETDFYRDLAVVTLGFVQHDSQGLTNSVAGL